MQSYVAEGCSHDTALILKWAESIGLFDDITLTSNIAAKTPRTGNIFSTSSLMFYYSLIVIFCCPNDRLLSDEVCKFACCSDG